MLKKKGSGLVGPDGQPLDADTATDSAKPQDADIERMKAEAAQAKDQYLRSLAELENTRKRLQRDKEEFLKFAAEGVIRELLPVLDGMSQALVAVDRQSDPQAVSKGVHMIYRQLLGLLEKEGVKRIATVGEKFDPHLHEAVAQVTVQDPEQDGTIVEEVHAGYTMHGKVVRPAMVKVANADTNGQQKTTGEAGEATTNG